MKTFLPIFIPNKRRKDDFRFPFPRQSDIMNRFGVENISGSRMVSLTLFDVYLRIEFNAMIRTTRVYPKMMIDTTRHNGYKAVGTIVLIMSYAFIPIAEDIKLMITGIANVAFVFGVLRLKTSRIFGEAKRAVANTKGAIIYPSARRIPLIIDFVSMVQPDPTNSVSILTLPLSKYSTGLSETSFSIITLSPIVIKSKHHTSVDSIIELSPILTPSKRK